jgi:hypothetical protein
MLSLQDAIAQAKNSVPIVKHDVTFTVKKIGNYFSPIPLQSDVASTINNDALESIRSEVSHVTYDTKYNDAFFKCGIPYFYPESSLYFASQGFPYTTGKSGKLNAQKIQIFCALYYNICDASGISNLLLKSTYGKIYASVLSEMLEEKTVFQIGGFTVGLHICNTVLEEVKTMNKTKVKNTVK